MWILNKPHFQFSVIEGVPESYCWDCLGTKKVLRKKVEEDFFPQQWQIHLRTTTLYVAGGKK